MVWLGSWTNRVPEVIPVARKNPYSLLDVKDMVVEGLVAARAGQAATVGVDVAKFEYVACLVWPDRAFERPWRVKSPEQVGLLVAKLRELHGHCPVTVALESTGTYGDVLRQAVADAGLAVRRVSSKAVKDQAETFDGVPSQHDGKDAAIIGTLCAGGHGSPWPLAQDVAKEQALRYWIRKLDTSQRIKQVWCGKLEAMLARHWPEIGGLLKPSSATLLHAVALWGDPRALAADAQAAAKLAGFGRSYLRPEKIQQVIASARQSIGVRSNDWTVRELREIATAILQRRARILHCRCELKPLSRDNACIQGQAPALGLVAACVLWMCLGDAANYASAAAYRKAMGLNLKERSSGMHKGKLSLSKRGQRLTRKWMYFAALRWMRAPCVRRWTEKKKQRDGGRGGKAVVGVMRRLALAAWHIGLGEEFQPERLFPGAGGVQPAQAKEVVVQ